jgi:hypothetical protein
MERKIYSVGDIVKMRKEHPCGGSEWQVLRVGADFRIKCMKCGHSVLLPRTDFEKAVKAVLRTGTEEGDEK